MILEAIIVWASFRELCDEPTPAASNPKPIASFFRPKPPVLAPPTTDPDVLAKLDACDLYP